VVVALALALAVALMALLRAMVDLISVRKISSSSSSSDAYDECGRLWLPPADELGVAGVAMSVAWWKVV